MPMIKLTELFKFSPDGMAVVEYPAGDHELEGRALEIAQGLGIVDDSAARAAAQKAEEEAAATAAAKKAEEEAVAAAAAKKAEEEAVAAAAAKKAEEEAAAAESKGGKGKAK